MTKSIIISHSSGIIINDKSGVESIAYQDIVSFQSEDGIIILHLENGQKKQLKTSLLGLVDQLPEIFFLCNRSRIINLLFAKSILDHMGEITLLLYNGEHFTVSRRKFKEIKERFVKIKVSTDYSQKPFIS